MIKIDAFRVPEDLAYMVENGFDFSEIRLFDLIFLKSLKIEQTAKNVVAYQVVPVMRVQDRLFE